MSARDIQRHVREICVIDISPDLVSAVTDSVLDEVAAWQARQLESSYAIVFFDASRVKIRDEGLVKNKAVYLAIGIRPSGHKQVLGLWIEQSEGAKFWIRVMSEIKARGTDILIAVVDGLKGFLEAITTVFPNTGVQTCIVYLIRYSLQFASWKERKPLASALLHITTRTVPRAPRWRLNFSIRTKWVENTLRLFKVGGVIGKPSFPSSPSRRGSQDHHLHHQCDRIAQRIRT